MLAELYHLLKMFFSALLLLISYIGSIGQFLYPWGHKHNISNSAGSRPLNGEEIKYPLHMFEQNKEGKVVLTCDVEKTGETSNCHIIQSSGEEDFDRESLRFAGNARYRPATKNGVPVKEYGHKYTISFRIDR